MDWSDIEARGLAMIGCGRMGSALLQGWLSRGLDPAALWIRDPGLSSPPRGADGARLNADLPPVPAILMLAVKPQMMDEALDGLDDLTGPARGKTLVVSIAAGLPLSRFEAAFGAAAPIVRAMPNTPAAIGHGITAIVGNASAGEADLDRAEALLTAGGAVVRLQDEAQMDAVTAVSGSGPAYLFHLVEALADAGAAEGLPRELSLRLASATVAGAARLAEDGDEAPADLRRAVTSPGGTTEAGLSVLMADGQGLADLMRRTVAAAAARSRELSR